MEQCCCQVLEIRMRNTEYEKSDCWKGKLRTSEKANKEQSHYPSSRYVVTHECANIQLTYNIQFRGKLMFK